MSTIQSRLIEIRNEIPEGVQLCAVSKFHDVEAIKEAYDAGQLIFGESRVQELLSKQPLLPDNIQWHFIGHLQTNKIKHVIGRVAMIESVDSTRLLSLIDSESRKAGVTTNVLMQLHVAEEETKFGFTPDELLEYFRNEEYVTLTNTHICGVMGMASNTDDKTRIVEDFQTISSTFRAISQECPDLRGFNVVSMGMSGDWPIAVEQGATIVRIGTAIFGARQY